MLPRRRSQLTVHFTADVEPRRSVRATKGQHTKSFDELETTTAPKRRQTKKSKKQQEQEDPEEVIRCVCGATEQDEDSGEAWISCEDCFVWQHNVCVGVSSFEDEIPENYWCEGCHPEDHKELLEGMARGEKPWEARRKAHEEEESKKKRKGGRKAKGKRTSDSKDELDKSKSPIPDTKDRKESTPGPRQGKRKSREDSNDTDGKVRLSLATATSIHSTDGLQSTKLRRVSDQGLAGPVSYTPPSDLAASVDELPDTRAGPWKVLKKSLALVLGSMAKNDTLALPDGETTESMSERYALQIERAVFDTHPASKGQKEYSQQIKSLAFNLKNNPEVCNGLVHGLHSPATLAVMTSEELASPEMQRQTAEMRAKAEKASILYTSDTGPRVRKTHKGEEVVEDESGPTSEVPPPMPGGSRRGADREQLIKRESVDQDAADSHANVQHSPSQANFDIGKVFSTVKSSPGAQNRRPSAPVLPTNGPGVDLDVDRMLQEDDNESPPYSPTEESQDPDVVWRGSLVMSSIADFGATAKHIGGANFSVISPWSKLIPKRMTVAGRISQQSATEYLCSLRYSDLTDVVVVSLTPDSAESRQEFTNMVEYFIKKERFGVVGDKVAGNVKDTYLIPVPAGDDNHPEFMLNLADNFIPKSRAEPMLLAVFVYRNDPEQLTQFRRDSVASAAAVPTTPSAPTPLVTGVAATGYAQRSNSIGGPGFSPATPQGSFSPYGGSGPPLQSTTPVPIPQPPHTRPQPPPVAAGQPTTGPSQSPPATQPRPTGQMTEQQKFQAQKQGQELAEEVLGPLIKASTAHFLLPQAFQMTRREWEVIKGIYEQDVRARDDLPYLAALLEKRGSEKGTAGSAAAQQNAAAA